MARASKGKVRYLRNLYQTIRRMKLFMGNLAWQWEADAAFGTPVQSKAFYEQWTAQHVGHPIVQAAFAPGGLLDGEAWFNKLKEAEAFGAPMFTIDSLQGASRPLTPAEREDNKQFSAYMGRLGGLKWDPAEFEPIRIKRLNEYTAEDRADLVEFAMFAAVLQGNTNCQTRSPDKSASI